MNNYGNEQGIALPLVLIFSAAFSVLALGMLIVAIDEMRLAGNFEHGVRAFYLAEAAANEAAAGYRDTGGAGPYTYEFTSGGDTTAIAQVTPIEAGQGSIKAKGCSGGVTKYVQMDIQAENESLLLYNWRDYGLDD
ncbi:MAG TPA: hypothetical protein VN462_01490 [Negativicutes bacterium]|nr:hypothetical protein [Negativicutes bacterium]